MLQTIKAHLRHQAKRLLGRPTAPPPVRGVADAAWYDAAFATIPSYGLPYWRSHYYFLWSVLADRIRRDGLRRVVDIGCGPGQFASCLFALTDIERYVGLDFSATAVEMARHAEPKGEFHVGDATTTTIAMDPSHDVLTCMEVLEHVPGDHDVIRQWRPGLRCLCTVPNFPYQSHVRHFLTHESVVERYAPFFDNCDVWGVQGHNAPKHVYWLIDGVRNTHGSEGVQVATANSVTTSGPGTRERAGR